MTVKLAQKEPHSMPHDVSVLIVDGEPFGRETLQVLLMNQGYELYTDPVEAGSLLRPLIRTLRRKLGYSTGQMGCLENVRSVGYRLVEP
jgi:hypothetical protein